MTSMRHLSNTQSEPDLINLHLDDAAQKKLESDSRDLVERYFQLEDPTLITPIGLETQARSDDWRYCPFAESLIALNAIMTAVLSSQITKRVPYRVHNRNRPKCPASIYMPVFASRSLDNFPAKFSCFIFHNLFRLKLVQCQHDPRSRSEKFRNSQSCHSILRKG
jgi:hypothetical protein